MFERYTDKARRVIFFAKYEASQLGASEITSGHLLLGLVREDGNILRRFLGPEAILDIRTRLEPDHPDRMCVSSRDIPLGNETKVILAHAAEQAELSDSRHIKMEHLFMGLFCEDCFASRFFQQHGLTLEWVRERLKTVESAPRNEPVPNFDPHDPDQQVVIERCAIVRWQNGNDAPTVTFKTMTTEEHIKTHLLAYEVACRWLESKGWIKGADKRDCHAYYEKGGDRAYVTTNMFPLVLLP